MPLIIVTFETVVRERLRYGARDVVRRRPTKGRVEQKLVLGLNIATNAQATFKTHAQDL